jgi:mono/diheme cytochrome c family protein
MDARRYLSAGASGRAWGRPVSRRRVILSGALVFAAGTLLLAGSAPGQQGGTAKPAPTGSPATGQAQAQTASPQDGAALRVEGEKRFQANCGRCHQSPHKFPPRMVMTIERHMRVRATLTDEDMRLIVRYLTQ